MNEDLESVNKENELLKDEVKKEEEKQAKIKSKEVSTIDKVSKNPLVKTVVREISRGFLGAIKSAFK